MAENRRPDELSYRPAIYAVLGGLALIGLGEALRRKG